MKTKAAKSQNINTIRAEHCTYDPKDMNSVSMALKTELALILSEDRVYSSRRRLQSLRIAKMIIENIEGVDIQFTTVKKAFDEVYKENPQFSKIASGAEGNATSINNSMQLKILKYFDILHRVGLFDQVRFMQKPLFNEQDIFDPRVKIYCETAIRYNNSLAVAKLHYRMGVMMRPLDLDSKLANVINKLISSMGAENKENQESFVQLVKNQSTSCDYHQFLNENLSHSGSARITI